MNGNESGETLRALRNLDAQALAQVYDLYSPLLYRFAMRQLGNLDQAEDCVAETFSNLLKAIKAGKGPRENLKAYLYRSAHNWITDTYRRNHIEEQVREDIVVEQTVEGEVLRNLECTRVRSALRQLTPDQRLVIVLRFLEGWELAETAVALGKPAGAVKSLQHRAIATLQRVLGEKERNGVNGSE
jgi:RNA polymerase sigma-70 factor (ECF subfamily)